MYSAPGGPQHQLIQHLANSFGGRQPSRTVGPVSVDSSIPGGTYTIPAHLSPYGAFHEDPNADEVNPLGPSWQRPFNLPQAPDNRGGGFQSSGIDPGLFAGMGQPDMPYGGGQGQTDLPLGATPHGLHPTILAALQHVRSMGGPQGSVSENGLGMHPQTDRFHAIHASQALATLMAQLSARGLKRNQYGGRH